MKLERFIILQLVFAVLFSACGGQPSWVDLSDSSGSLGLLDEQGLLAFIDDDLNTSRERLDLDCGIRADAASNIIMHRNGPDGLTGTADDDPIESLDELSAVRMVGPQTLQLLYLCAARFDYLFSDRLGLTAFLNDQARTNLSRLDIGCALRRDSAQNLIRHRDGRDMTPDTADDNLFDDIGEIDAVSVVGLWTIERLYSCAEKYGYVNAAFFPPPDSSTTIYDFYSLDTSLQEVILEDLTGRAAQLAGPDVAESSVHFAEATTYTNAGEIVGYEVDFTKDVDSANDTGLFVEFILDQNFIVKSSRVQQ
ncbi:MAG TPA: hypothetical protein VM425_08260 [Myxococcota bacterium]|nr:hypothetical protein [Myxococcota bacterium]